MDHSAEQKALLQCIAVCCSVLQCVAVRCSALQFAKSYALVHLLSYRHALPVRGKQRAIGTPCQSEGNNVCLKQTQIEKREGKMKKAKEHCDKDRKRNSV